MNLSVSAGVAPRRMVSTSAEPTMTPSEKEAASRACSGVVMPIPTYVGTSEVTHTEARTREASPAPWARPVTAMRAEA